MEPPKDTETYIHWSGWTAWAGANGSCITFFNDRTDFLIQKIESQAGIEIKTVDPPKPGENR